MDPHRFSATNKVILRLRYRLSLRHSCNCDFVENDFRLYSFVHEAEMQVLHPSVSLVLQSDEFEETKSNGDGNDLPAQYDQFGWKQPSGVNSYNKEVILNCIGFEAEIPDYAWGHGGAPPPNPPVGEYVASKTPEEALKEQLDNSDFFWFHVESSITLYHQLKDAETWKQIYLAIMQYMRAVSGKSMMMTAAKSIETVCGMIQKLMDTPQLQGDEPENNPFRRFRKWLTLCENVADHPVVIRIKKIFYYIMSYSLLERFGITFNRFWYTKAEEELIKTHHSSDSGFFYALIEGASFILERLYDCYSTKSWSPIVHSGRTYGKWVDEVYALKEMSMKLHNPEANGISYHEFLGRLSQCIEQGTAISKYADGMAAAETTLIKKLLSDLRLLQATECTKKAARESRQTPFTILYYGGSSIGKSTLQSLTYQHFAKVHGLPYGSEYHYTRSFSDEYWSGFQTSMWSIVLDDIASRNPNAHQGDPSMEEVLQIINQVPYTPPQADLADKGKTPLRPLLVQGTTNVKTLNASSYYCNQLAILRRFPMVVTPTVKPEYCAIVNGRVPDPMSRVLDSSRTPTLEPGEYPDYWNFTVERVIAETNSVTGMQYAKYVPYGTNQYEFTSIHDFLSFVSVESIKHRANQDLVDASEQAYRSSKVCDTCFRTEMHCVCSGELQSGEEDDDSYRILMYLGSGMVLYHYITLGINIQYVSYTLCILVLLNFIWQHTDYFTNWLDDYIAARVSSAMRRPFRGFTRASNNVRQTATNVRDTLAEITDTVSRSYLSNLERLRCEQQLVREAMCSFGNRVREFSVKHKLFLAFISLAPTAAAVAAIYKAWTRLNVQSSSDEGERPTAKDEKPNPWYRDDYEPTTFDVGTLTRSWKALSMEEVGAKVYRNCLFGIARYERDGMPKSRKMRILGLGGNLYVTNNHNFPEVDIKLEVVMQRRTLGVSQNFTIFIGVDDVFRRHDRDLVFFRMKCTPPLPNLINLIPGESYRGVCNGILCGRDDMGNDEFEPMRAITYDPKAYAYELGTSFPSWCATVTKDTVKGMCGSTVLGFTQSGPMILGLHQTGGNSKRVSAVSITREVIETALQHFKVPLIQAGAPDLTDADGMPIQLQPLHHKSVFRYMEKGVANVYGSLPGFRGSHRSKVKKSYIADDCVELGYVIATGPPVMRGWAPWRIAAMDIVEQTFDVRQSLLDECVNAFTKDILSALKADQLKEIILLDNATTLNGYPGTKFIDKMNRKTSMGFPYRKKKIHYLTYRGQHDVWDDYVEFHDKFYERVDGIIDTYAQSTRYMPIFVGHLKDEPIKLSKIESKATRVFSGGPAEWCFVVRKYLLSLVRVMQNNKYIFETAPGTNATSAEWDQIYHYLTKFGKDRIVAGDYSKFDKRMSAQWILAAFQVIDNILEAAGRSDKDRLVVQGIAYDTAFPLTDFNGDLVEFWGSNPSGHPLTVIINGIVNSLIIRYVWALAGNSLDRFKALVHLMTYGDDNIMGISPEVSNFDHTVLVEKLKTVGYTYTMADKDRESVPFINISEATFLKRGWRMEPEIGHHVAQIEHASIAKMLTMHLPSKVVCDEQHAVDAMFTALAEYFFYGREEFDKRKEMFTGIIIKRDLLPYLQRSFPTFDDILAVYMENSKDVYPEGRCPTC
ncbi:hypothetical protein 1 [Beihai picorna-like virus 47]|uniref:hypothetical protein 1 n=1 Tax=Beihai picorna-like virus 47 TaxID=1922591 RepID=UPI00090AD04E|nr:hypothetical protein 1 [Beihai picorna-like virus 47]APG78024.1 hypothetical protein 1 [Beihai picorna-like virus 47]